VRKERKLRFGMVEMGSPYGATMVQFIGSVPPWSVELKSPTARVEYFVSFSYKS
jgi:hypothetical protein